METGPHSAQFHRIRYHSSAAVADVVGAVRREGEGPGPIRSGTTMRQASLPVGGPVSRGVDRCFKADSLIPNLHL